MTTTNSQRIAGDLELEVRGAVSSVNEDERADEAPPESLAMVIFGATGDLTHRKLIPALYHLGESGLLPDHFAIVGFGRSERSQDEFCQGLKDAVTESGVTVDSRTWQTFMDRIVYVQGQYDDEASYRTLAETLDGIDTERRTEQHRLFYLATPPSVYSDVVTGLREAGLNRANGNGWVRLVVEKPFGHDLQSARELDQCIHEAFEESQVYRIDHYLGKDTVQNIFVLRFVNGIFEPLWNRRYVDHVQITVAEAIGVEGRGGYYDTAGATRDMLQSHLLQLLTLTAMEPPSAFTADKVRDEKVKVLDALTLADPQNPLNAAAFGQYEAGVVEGEKVPGYRQEEGVPERSTTETYVAAKFLVDNWRWAGVPFYLRTGKHLASRVSEIAIQFRRAPLILLPGGRSQLPRSNALVLRIQPDDGLDLQIQIKVPGPNMKTRSVDMSFLYKDAFGAGGGDAYERLLLDAMRGDSTLFARTDEVDAAWALVQPLLEARSRMQPSGMPLYAAGTWGPAEAEELLERDGRRWRRP